MFDRVNYNISFHSPQLYTVFWALSMYELYVPTERYDAEIHKLNLAIDSIDDNKELVNINLYLLMSTLKSKKLFKLFWSSLEFC